MNTPTSSTTHIDYDSVADIYDLYVTADEDVPFFLQEATDVAGPVLELASGTGRLSLPLITAGVELTCIDVSQGMLDVLASKLRERGLSAELRCADLCGLELDARFALALLPFHSFMEILGESRQRQALAAVWRALRPGGRFICTLHNPDVRRARVDGTSRLVGVFATREGTLVVSGFESGGHPVVKRLQFHEFFGTDGTLLSKRLLRMEFELIEMSAFQWMALDAGFTVVDLFGSYERAPFDARVRPFMIWVLAKPDGAQSRLARTATPEGPCV